MWKEVYGWEHLYEVSEFGEVRSMTTGKLITGDVNNAGYYRVCLYARGHTPERQRFFRHRLVAEHFIPNPSNLPEVNHINCDRSCNSVDNLEWIDRRDNERYSRVCGAKAYKPFRTTFCDGFVKTCETAEELAMFIGIKPSAVRQWLRHSNLGYISKGIISIEYI